MAEEQRDAQVMASLLNSSLSLSLSSCPRAHSKGSPFTFYTACLLSPQLSAVQRAHEEELFAVHKDHQDELARLGREHADMQRLLAEEHDEAARA